MADSDPEVTAMAAVVAALDPLDEATRHRVIGWAQQRYEDPWPRAVEALKAKIDEVRKENASLKQTIADLRRTAR